MCTEQPPAEQETPIVETRDDKSVVVRIGDARLPFQLNDDAEPRIRDEDFARWLGFKRPRDIRKIVERMIQTGKLRQVFVVTLVQKTTMPKGGTREQTISEYWLTRTQALLVATQSETPRAWSLTETIVKVFEMVLDRKAQPLTQEDLEREFLTAESRVKELRKQAQAAAIVLAPYSRASVEQLVAIALEAAKGVVGYGGLGRELGHTTQDQFFAMRSALLGFVRFAATLPKPRKPRLTKQLPGNLGAAKQTSLNLELDCATVLLTVIPHEPAQVIA